MATPLTQEEIRAMADEWFKLLDEHARQVYLMPFLDENVVQAWPDYDVQNIADFEGWYQRALRLFFDEVHTIKEFDVKVNGDGSQFRTRLEWALARNYTLERELRGGGMSRVFVAEETTLGSR